MQFEALAADYDGTLAHKGRVDAPTIDALNRLKASGRRLVMVTGRELNDLRRVFPEVEQFDLVVAENGALLYHPAESREWTLAEPPPKEFVERLKARGAQRFSTGRVIVATWEPAQTIALELIHEMGLELQIIFNKGAVMILPTGVNKATGLEAGLEVLGLSSEQVIGVGDAENDHALLEYCGLSAAVANALPSLKQEADIVLQANRGAGVTELIDAWLGNNLARLTGSREGSDHPKTP